MRMKRKRAKDDVKGGEDNHLQSRKRDCVYAGVC